MKKLIITGLVLLFCVTFAWAQKTKSYQQDPAKMTQEQRMVQSNAKKKNGGRNADVSKKVKRAKKQDRAARRMKQPKTNKPKR